MKLALFAEYMENALPQAGFSGTETQQFITDCIRRIPNLIHIPYDKRFFDIRQTLAFIHAVYGVDDPKASLLADPQKLISVYNKKASEPAPADSSEPLLSPAGTERQDMANAITFEDVVDTIEKTYEHTRKKPVWSSGQIFHGKLARRIRTWSDIDTLLKEGRVKNCRYRSLKALTDSAVFNFEKNSRISLDDIEAGIRAHMAQNVTRPVRNSGNISVAPLKGRIESWRNLEAQFQRAGTLIEQNPYRSIGEFCGARKIFTLTPEAVEDSARSTVDATNRIPLRTDGLVKYGRLKGAYSWFTIDRHIVDKKFGFEGSIYKNLRHFCRDRVISPTRSGTASAHFNGAVSPSLKAQNPNPAPSRKVNAPTRSIR